METEVRRIKYLISNAKDNMMNNDYKPILKWDGADVNSFYRLIEEVIKKQIKIAYSMSGMLNLPGFNDYGVKLIHLRVRSKKNAFYIKQILKSLYYDLESSRIVSSAQEIFCNDEKTLLITYLYEDKDDYDYDNVLFAAAVTIDDRIPSYPYGEQREIICSKEEILTFIALRDFSLYQDSGALSTEEYFRDIEYISKFLEESEINTSDFAFLNRNTRIKRVVKLLRKQAFNLSKQDKVFMRANKLTNKIISDKCIKLLESIQSICIAQGGE